MTNHPFQSYLIRLMFGLILLDSTAAAAAPPLTMFWRRDAKTVREVSGNEKADGLAYLVPNDPGAKLAVIDHELAARIVLPKRTSNPAQVIEPKVRLMKRNHVIGTNHFQVDISMEDEQKITNYLFKERDGNQVELDPGKRFEPMLEIRGFTVDGQPAVSAVIVPTFLDLEFDKKESDLDEDAIVFRGIYIPYEVRNQIGVSKRWKTKPKIDKEPKKEADTSLDCQVEFLRDQDTLRFHFLDRHELVHQIEELSKSEGSLDFIFTPIDDGGTDSRAIQHCMPRGVEKDKGRFAQVSRPSRRTLGGRFSALAPASNSELPLYVKAAFTYDARAAGKQNIGTVNAALNFDKKLNPAFGFLSWGKRYSIAPSVLVKMNTTGIVNDENSFSAQIPFSVRFLPPGCCRGEDKFRIPALRQVSFLAGYLGEAARVSEKRLNGGFVESRQFLARVKSKDFSYRLETIAGWEVGRYREKAVNTFTEASTTGRVLLPDQRPNTEDITVSREGMASRIRWGAHSTLTMGPKSSFSANLDFRQLLKEETFFDSTTSAKGYFVRYPGQELPASFERIDHKLGFISAKRFRAGTTRYLEIVFNQEVSKYFDVAVSYSRGELPPAFQFVNKFEAGIALKILGRDSALSR